MNSAPHLLPEDRQEFARVLDEALRSANRRPELGAIGQRLNAEQLRTMALAAAAAISAAAAAEYQNYVKLRDELREPPTPVSGTSRPGGGADHGSSDRGGADHGDTGHGDTDRDDADRDDAGHSGGRGFAGAVGEAAETSGAGLLAVFAVLAPVLAGAAAAIFLLIGYLLRVVSPDEPLAEPIINAGWVFLVLTAGGIVIAMGGLLLTALRDGSGSLRASADDDHTSEVAIARDAWRQALLERGVVPFLRDVLADPASAARATNLPKAGDSGGRTPHLGYSRPGFSSPSAESGPGQDPTRPRFQSPGFSSPDYGGPEHQPE